MANILTFLWTLLTDLPGALRPRKAASRARPQRADGAQENCVQSPPPRHHPDDVLIPDAAAAERAMAELMHLFAQWQAGTLPPPPPPAARYRPHPSWHPIWLRRRTPPEAPAPPPEVPLRRAPARRQAPPARPAQVAPLSPAPLPPAAIPAPRHRAPSIPHSAGLAPRPALPQRAANPARIVLRPAETARRAKAATRPTPILLR